MSTVDKQIKLTNSLNVASSRTSFLEHDPNQHDQHEEFQVKSNPRMMAVAEDVEHRTRF